MISEVGSGKEDLDGKTRSIPLITPCPKLRYEYRLGSSGGETNIEEGYLNSVFLGN